MFIQSIFMKILTILLVCWLGLATCQSSADDQELEIGINGEGPPEKQELPQVDYGNGNFYSLL
ncbi:uncharacterized protein LOC108095228 [Drosophila ficusphila]|uniref:uncharacterized protein LOC108095228 n=1 Tax=Drosophila ficusphila TaxID=30025 RepID=UPI0007E841A2|nr:uncharacterized protein LOC108095228 [Drosophila ficusphila]